jgi:hypothetical protein
MTQHGEISWWLQQAGRFPLLTAEQELTLGRLIQTWQSDPEPSPAIERRGRRARDRMVAANLRLVVLVARRYQQHTGSAMGFEDLIQGGNCGLIRACEKFDPARGYKFSTYAYWWVQQGVCSVIDRESRTIRMPTTFAPRLHALGRATQQLVGKLGREPTRQELADALGMRLCDLEAVLAVGSRCSSLDRMLRDDGETSWLECLAAPEAPEDPLQDELQQRLQQLPDDLAQLVVDAYGLEGQKVTRRVLAKRAGCSPAELTGRLQLAERMLGRSTTRAGPPAVEATTIKLGQQLTLLDVGAPPPALPSIRPDRVRRARRPASPVLQPALLLC